jgi:hypothetical protein
LCECRAVLCRLIFEDRITKGRRFAAYFPDQRCLKRTHAKSNDATPEIYRGVPASGEWCKRALNNPRLPAYFI